MSSRTALRYADRELSGGLRAPNDLENQFGNWPLANQQMELALKHKNYDYRYWWGDGIHGSRHMAVMLPEMIKRLWSE